LQDEWEVSAVTNVATAMSMRRDSAEKINALAMDCARRLAASVIATKKDDGESIYFPYMFRASDIARALFVNILDPLWKEHIDLAPRWYREDAERRVRGDKPTIAPDTQLELLALMDELQQKLTATIDIAAGSTDEQGLIRFRQGVDQAVEAISTTREIVSAIQVQDGSAGEAFSPRLARRHADRDPDAMIESWLRRAPSAP
jgi:hypothetical protein